MAGPVIAIAAGGTGGHIFPAIATGVAIQSLAPDATVMYVCGERPLELDLYKRSGIEPVVFPARQIRAGVIGKVFGVLAAMGNTWRAWKWLRSVKADVAIGFGGYVAGPTMLAAKVAGCRTAIHEANSIPGRTNRILGPWVDLSAAHFESTLPRMGGKNLLAVGMPIRPLDSEESKTAAREKLGLDPGLDTVLIMGGSQGARFLYESIMAQMPELDQRLSAPVQVLWSTGDKNFDQLKAAAEELSLQKIRLHIVPFISDMGNALRAADIAVARAGASALAELTSFRVYTVYVPLPTAIYDHQTLNAREAESYDVGRIVTEKEVPSRIADEIMAALDRVRSGFMPDPPDSLDSQNAAGRLAEKVLELASL